MITAEYMVRLEIGLKLKAAGVNRKYGCENWGISSNLFFSLSPALFQILTFLKVTCLVYMSKTKKNKTKKCLSFNQGPK